ncbi:conserved hypothetical protein [Burkholderiales bacterium 8X]|nr:conserved hypothetical protein [Burkholderiales bacterium 8X]
MPERDRFGWSRREQALREQAAAIAAAHAPAAGAALSLADLRKIFRALEPTGYLGSILPPEAGGKGLDVLEFAALNDGLSPSLALLGNHSVQRYLHGFGDAAQVARFMPGLLCGEEVGAIAITEPQAGSDLSRIATIARRSGGGYVLSGRKTWITHGLVASMFIVLANTGDREVPEFTRFIVPGDTPGLRRTALRPVGLSHLSFAEIEFGDCEIPAELRLGREGEGAAGAKAAFPIARMLAALQALGIARAALDLAQDYARQRTVAAHPLSASSLVQEGHASLSARCEAARLLCLRVGADLGADDALPLASSAKALGGELALQACHWAADCMGSSALAVDHPIARLQADARMMSIVDGTSVLNHLVAARRGIAARAARAVRAPA